MYDPENHGDDLSRLDELLVRNYGCFIGGQELELVHTTALSESDRIRRAGMFISQGCISLMLGEEAAADRLYADAQDEIIDHGPGGEAYLSNAGIQAVYSNRIANLLELRNQPSKILKARLSMHKYIVSGLVKGLDDFHQVEDRLFQHPENVQRLSGAAGSQRGEVFERLAIAHLTRRAYPWALALPALWYNNSYEEDRAGSYDMIVVNGGNPSPMMDVSKIQDKCFCFGYCGNEQKSIKSERKFRSEYYDDIVFLSGHCDFGIYEDDKGKWQFPTADPLIREVKGEASTEDTVLLNEITDRLFKTVLNAGPERRGLRSRE